MWQVVSDGLEARFGVAGSRAEIYDAVHDQLRVEVGGGVVVEFEFPERGGPAAAVVLLGQRFERMHGGAQLVVGPDLSLSLSAT